GRSEITSKMAKSFRSTSSSIESSRTTDSNCGIESFGILSMDYIVQSGCPADTRQFYGSQNRATTHSISIRYECLPSIRTRSILKGQGLGSSQEIHSARTREMFGFFPT